VATSCTRGGRIGLFTQATGRWEPAALALSGRLRTASTSVLTLSSGTGQTTALVLARSARGNDLLALWQSASGTWSASAPLPLPAGTSVSSAANGIGGAMTVLAASTAYQVFPGRPWVRLSSPPAGTVAIASTIPATTVYAAADADAFVVHGAELRVFALTPSGATWALVQRTQVPLAYGSSG
jgi:hypothetical protein